MDRKLVTQILESANELQGRHRVLGRVVWLAPMTNVRSI